MRFFVGISEPAHAKHFSASFISVNRLRRRKRDFMAGDWIMDCAGFTELSRFGEYRHSPQDYAEEIKRWKCCGNLLAAVSQDYMCEPFMLAKTGLPVADHQRMTLERYRQLVAADPGVYILPVLQGYAPAEYVSHIRQYGELLKPGMWVGVGSVCKRNANPYLVLEVIMAIHDERPDLRLHGFGLKMTALSNPWIVEELYTADSMAWNYAARKQGRDNNDYREALGFERRVKAVSSQPQLNMFMRTCAE